VYILLTTKQEDAMKKFKKRERIKEYWQRVMDSKQDKISRGAANIDKIISWARGENWRGKQKDRKRRHEHKQEKKD